jgi:hypothetical protein
MTTQRIPARLVRSACGAAILAGLALGTAESLVARQQPAVAWGDLTVPAGRLPEGCALVPVTPARGGAAAAGVPPQGAATSAGAPVFVASPMFPTGMRSNPWIGTDPAVLAALRDQVEGASVQSPADSWWPDRRQSAAATERAAGGVEEGYAALYAHNVAVYAVRLAAGVDRREPLPRNAVDVAVIRIDLGRVAVAVHTDNGPCGKAIVAHLRALRRP